MWEDGYTLAKVSMAIAHHDMVDNIYSYHCSNQNVRALQPLPRRSPKGWVSIVHIWTHPKTSYILFTRC